MAPTKRRLSFSSPSPRYPVRIVDRPGPKSRSNYTPRSMRLLQSVGAQPSIGRIARMGISSKSAGKLVTSKMSARRNKKYRKRKPYVVNGVTRVIEAGGVIGGSGVSEVEVAWIGHAAPVYQIKYCMWWAALRKLLMKAGGQVAQLSFQTVLGGAGTSPVGTVTGDLFVVNLKATESSGVTNVGFTLLAGSTVSDVITFFAETNASLQTDTVNVLDFTVIPNLATNVLGRAVLRLQTCYMKVDWKSDLKLQNRTVTVAADDTVDDVNNAPIYGKTYEGPGLGPVYKAINGGGSFSANASTGVLTFPIASPTTNNEYSEPLEYQKFEKVTKIGKAHMDPGQIKTSVLSRTFTASFNYLLTSLNPQISQLATAAGNRSNLNGKFSHYRMFGLEKMLDASTAATSTAPSVAYELNTKIQMTIQERRDNPTAQDFIKFRP